MSSNNVHTSDSDMSGIFDDATFSNLQFDNYASVESPFDANRFFDLSAADTSDSPASGTRTPSRPIFESTSNPAHYQTQPFPPTSLVSPLSAQSSSQGSSSESSGRRKRKTTSESPPTENMAGLKVGNHNIKPEGGMMDTLNYHSAHNPGTSMHDLRLDQDFMTGSTAMNSHFDFDSAASSPGGMGQAAYTTQPSLNNLAVSLVRHHTFPKLMLTRAAPSSRHNSS